MLEKQIETANQWIDAHLSELTKMSDTIFDHPEIGPHEYKSSALLTQYLEDHGFAVTRGLAPWKRPLGPFGKMGKAGLISAFCVSLTPCPAWDMAAAISFRDPLFWAQQTLSRKPPEIAPLP